MSASRALLDDLELVPATLETLSSLRFQPPGSLAFQLPAPTGRRVLTRPVPLFSRRPPLDMRSPLWPAYCQLLKELGIALYASHQSLEQLPVASVPVRFGFRAAAEPLERLELETAEAFELSCALDVNPALEYCEPKPVNGATRGPETFPAIPLELSHCSEMPALLTAIRELADGSTPVGIGLHAGHVAHDVRWAANAGADFIVLEFPGNLPSQSLAGESLTLAVAHARDTLQQLPRPLPLLVDAPLSDPEDIGKLLALGATAVSVDQLIAATLPAPARPSPLSQGLLSGLAAHVPTPAPDLSAARSRLTQTLDLLRWQIMSAGVRHCSELHVAHLRARSPRMAELSGAPLRR
jgi:hypothetical protein